jgi:hypothetical protein
MTTTDRRIVGRIDHDLFKAILAAEIVAHPTGRTTELFNKAAIMTNAVAKTLEKRELIAP